MAETLLTSSKRFCRWSGWPRVGTIACGLVLVLIAAMRREHSGVHVMIGRFLVLLAGLALVVRGKDRYDFLQAVAILGLGLIQFGRFAPVIVAIGGMVLLFQVFVWWIDNHVPDE